MFGIPFNAKDLYANEKEEDHEELIPLDIRGQEKKSRDMISVSSSPEEPRFNNTIYKICIRD